MLAFGRDFRLQIREPSRQAKQVARFTRRPAGNTQEVRIFLVWFSSRTFNNVARYRYTGSPKLRLETETFFDGELHCRAIDIEDELIRHVKDVELFEVVAHAATPVQIQDLRTGRP